MALVSNPPPIRHESAREHTGNTELDPGRVAGTSSSANANASTNSPGPLVTIHFHAETRVAVGPSDGDELPAPENLPPERPPFEQFQKDLMSKMAELQALLMESHQDGITTSRLLAFQDQANGLAMAWAAHKLEIDAATLEKETAVAKGISQIVGGATQGLFAVGGLGAAGRSASLAKSAGRDGANAANLSANAKKWGDAATPLSSIGTGLSQIGTAIADLDSAEKSFDAARKRADSKITDKQAELYSTNYQLMMGFADQYRDALKGLYDAYQAASQSTQGANSSIARNYS